MHKNAHLYHNSSNFPAINVKIVVYLMLLLSIRITPDVTDSTSSDSTQYYPIELDHAQIRLL